MITYRLMFAGQDEQARENMRKERRRIQVRISSVSFMSVYATKLLVHNHAWAETM